MKNLYFLGEDCKNRWKALRDCYRKALKSRATRSGQAAKSHRSWKVEKQMEFLKHHLQYQRETTSNIDPLAPRGIESIIIDIKEDTTDNEASSSEPTPVQSSAGSSVAGNCVPKTPKRRKQTIIPQTSPSAAAFQEYMSYKKAKTKTP
nr:unnamed protein product [Callosobruchus chinensis]